MTLAPWTADGAGLLLAPLTFMTHHPKQSSNKHLHCTFTVTLILSDEDFGKLVSGNAKAQSMFMSGKLKIKGNVMKATKMEPILKRAQSKAKL